MRTVRAIDVRTRVTLFVTHPVHRGSVALLARLLRAALLLVFDRLKALIAPGTGVLGDPVLVVVLGFDRVAARDLSSPVGTVGVAVHGGKAEQEAQAQDGQSLQEGGRHHCRSLKLGKRAE